MKCLEGYGSELFANLPHLMEVTPQRDKVAWKVVTGWYRLDD